MKPRLIATYKESRDGLFQSLRNTFDKFLARDPIDWKRSFGRPSRNVFIQLTFDAFDPNSITLEESWLLCNRPFLHMFWIDCELETYKSSIKELVSEWLIKLKEKDIHDWLIVVVTNMDSRVKNKLLRNSVYDKVKNDFCSKQAERCILLSEPCKLDSKSLESYNLVAARMRTLVVDSITRVLDRFEENMRSQRERRVEPEWNFCSYFLLQEELAFMYEMMGLYEDALIQYDELDALFTQFILNSAIADPAPWLELMCRNLPSRWGGSCLCQPIDQDTRNLVSVNKCSILDLRSYLFGRQGHLLVQLSRISELIKRSVPFIHNCIREVKILKIHLPLGAVDCWTFLSCMEVLNLCPIDNKIDSEDAKIISSGAAELWNLATQKANGIGRMCGLVSMNSKPSPDEQLIIDALLPGLVHAAGEAVHLNRLIEVLSGKEPYIQFYLDLSEQCICFLKHVGRIRSAKFIGKELADFYIMTGDYEKGESYLIDLLKMYKAEGWEMLANDVRQKVAACQKFLDQTVKYCRTCFNIASSNTVPLQVRKSYLKDAIQCSEEQAKGERMKMKCSPSFIVSFVNPSSDIILHHPTQLQLEIFSNLPSDVTFDEIVLQFKRKVSDEEKISSMKRKHKRNFSTDSMTFLSQKSHSRQDSGNNEGRRNSISSTLGGFELFNKISETVNFNFHPIDIQSSVEYFDDGSQQLPISSSLLCGSPLRRSLSSPKSQTARLTEEVDAIFKTGHVTLSEGRNVIPLDGLFSKSGSYHVSSVIMKLNQIDISQSLYSDDVSFDVKLQELNLHLTSKNDFVAGFKQKIEVMSGEAKQKFSQKSLEFRIPDGLVLKCGTFVQDADDKMILSPDILDGFKLTKSLDFEVFISLDEWRNSEIFQRQITLKSPDHVDSTYSLSFRNPFSIYHKIFASLTKKFIQVVVSSKHQHPIEISSWNLSDHSGDIVLKSLNDCQAMTLHPGSASAFVWQVDEEGLEDVKFNMKYHELHQSGDQYDLGYCFQIRFTKIKLTYRTHLSDNELLLNEWIPIKFVVSRVEDISRQDLVYKITYNKNHWLISGSISGEIKSTCKHSKILIKAKPLVCDQITLPKITFFLNSQEESIDGTLEDKRSHLMRVDSSFIFDASKVSDVFVKSPNPVPTMHRFDVAIEASS